MERKRRMDKKQIIEELVEAYKAIYTLRQCITKAELKRLTNEDVTNIQKIDIYREKLKQFLLLKCDKSIELTS